MTKELDRFGNRYATRCNSEKREQVMRGILGLVVTVVVIVIVLRVMGVLWPLACEVVTRAGSNFANSGLAFCGARRRRNADEGADMSDKTQTEIAQEALRLKVEGTPDRPENDDHPSEGTQAIERPDYPPSGAFDAEGQRPVLERSRKVRWPCAGEPETGVRGEPKSARSPNRCSNVSSALTTNYRKTPNHAVSIQQR